jgi:hypothetical protein
VLAIQARNEAEVQRGQAEGLVEFMIGDLRNKLPPKVQLEVLGVIADRAKGYWTNPLRGICATGHGVS